VATRRLAACCLSARRLPNLTFVPCWDPCCHRCLWHRCHSSPSQRSQEVRGVLRALRLQELVVPLGQPELLAERNQRLSEQQDHLLRGAVPPQRSLFRPWVKQRLPVAEKPEAGLRPLDSASLAENGIVSEDLTASTDLGKARWQSATPAQARVLRRGV